MILHAPPALRQENGTHHAVEPTVAAQDHVLPPEGARAQRGDGRLGAQFSLAAAFHASVAPEPPARARQHPPMSWAAPAPDWRRRQGRFDEYGVLGHGLV